MLRTFLNIFITQETPLLSGWCFYAKMLSCFLTFCKQLQQHPDIILIFFLFFFRQFIIWYQILVDPKCGIFSRTIFRNSHSPVVELMIPAPPDMFEFSQKFHLFLAQSGSIRTPSVCLHHMYPYLMIIGCTDIGISRKSIRTALRSV